MDVIVLDRVFDDAELGTRSGGERAAHDREDAGGAETAYGRRGPQGHVDGMDGPMCRADTMRNPRPASEFRFAARAAAAAAPRTGCGQGELDGVRPHLD
jgi:hypothetical protein